MSGLVFPRFSLLVWQSWRTDLGGSSSCQPCWRRVTPNKKTAVKSMSWMCLVQQNHNDWSMTMHDAVCSVKPGVSDRIWPYSPYSKAIPKLFWGKRLVLQRTQQGQVISWWRYEVWSCKYWKSNAEPFWSLLAMFVPCIEGWCIKSLIAPSAVKHFAMMRYQLNIQIPLAIAEAYHRRFPPEQPWLTSCDLCRTVVGPNKGRSRNNLV